jgi:hypothetical protein
MVSFTYTCRITKGWEGKRTAILGGQVLLFDLLFRVNFRKGA